MSKLSITTKSDSGAKGKAVELNETMFGIVPNQPVMHQVVVAQMAAARAGTHSTKTRAEVSGGGAKPWRQKGTGRARQGSTRSPQWRGGGIAHGPKPRDYSQKTPKKMIRLALYSALSDRLQIDAMHVIEDFKFEKASTKKAVEILTSIGTRPDDAKWPSVLLVLNREEEVEYLSFRNITQVQCILSDELNAYDILTNDHIVFSKLALEEVQARYMPSVKKEDSKKEVGK